MFIGILYVSSINAPEEPYLIGLVIFLRFVKVECFNAFRFDLVLCKTCIHSVKESIYFLVSGNSFLLATLLTSTVKAYTNVKEILNPLVERKTEAFQTAWSPWFANMHVFIKLEQRSYATNRRQQCVVFGHLKRVWQCDCVRRPLVG